MYSLKTEQTKKFQNNNNKKKGKSQRKDKKIGRSVQERKYSNNLSFRKKHLRKWVGEN